MHGRLAMQIQPVPPRIKQRSRRGRHWACRAAKRNDAERRSPLHPLQIRRAAADQDHALGPSPRARFLRDVPERDACGCEGGRDGVGGKQELGFLLAWPDVDHLRLEAVRPDFEAELSGKAGEKREG